MKKFYIFFVLLTFFLVSFGQQSNLKNIPDILYNEKVQTNSTQSVNKQGKLLNDAQANIAEFRLDDLFAKAGKKNNSINPVANDFYNNYKKTSAPVLKAAGTGKKALVYIDKAFENDGIVDGIENLEYTVTFASDWDDFDTGLASGIFELAVAINQQYNTSFDITTAQEYIASGGKMIFTTWDKSNVAEAALFEASFTGNRNCKEISISDSRLAYKITNPFTLTNVSEWSVFSLGLEPTGSGEMLATFTDCSGDAAIIRGNGGRTIMIGYVSDSPPSGVRQSLFENIINNIAVEDIVVDNDPGKCGAVVNYPAPTAEGATVTQTDDSGLISGDEFPVGTTVQEFEFDFGEGVTETHSFTVTVEDTEPPVLECPEDMVVSNDTGECGAVVYYGETLLDDVQPGSLSEWTILDTQYNPILTLEEIESPYDGSTAIKTSVVGYTIMMCETKNISKVYNISGNSSVTKLSAYLEFESDLSYYNCPYITVELQDDDGNLLGNHSFYGQNKVGTYFQDIISSNPDSYTELPAAGVSELDLSKIGEDIEFSKIKFYIHNYACSGTNSVIFDNLRVIDGTDPVASDNCSEVQVEASIPSGSFFPVGTTEVTLTATDEAGNTTSCTFNVTVEDTEAPVAVCKNTAKGNAVYVSSTEGEPWGKGTNKEEMDMVFGSGNWNQFYYETADAEELFSAKYDFIFMEGGEYIANTMEAFVDANITAMENWVANGGNLFLNAAPNEGDGMDWGFGGVKLVFDDDYSTLTDYAEATDPLHPIFSGPFTPVITGIYEGNSFAHAIIPEDLNSTVLMHDAENPDKHILTYAKWGKGNVLFGGMTLSYFHYPQPEAQNLRANMLDFLSQKTDDFILEGDNDAIVITPEDIDGGSYDNCGIASITVSPNTFTKNNAGENEVTLTVTDNAGNTSTCTSTIRIITSNEPPEVVVNHLDIYLDETGKYRLTHEDLEKIAEGTTDDNTPFEELKLSGYPSLFTCKDVGIINHLNLTVKDNDGNVAKMWTTISVKDTILPIFIPVEDIVILLEDGDCNSVTTVNYPEISMTEGCGSELSLIEGFGSDGLFPVGTTTEVWTAVNSSGIEATLSFNVIIKLPYEAPTLDAIDNITADEDSEPVTVGLTGISYALACEGQIMAITATTDNNELFSSIVVNYSEGDSNGSLILNFTPDKNGVAEVTVTLEDGLGGMAVQSFTVTVNPVNDPPYVVKPTGTQKVRANQVLQIPVSPVLGELFDDPDGDELTITITLKDGTALPAWAVYENDVLVFSPTADNIGCIDVVIKAADPHGASATDEFEICAEGDPVSAELTAAGEFSVSIYPNPTRKMVNLKITKNDFEPVYVTVYNIAGQQILKRDFGQENLITFSMDEQVAGIYFVKINAGEKETVKKLVLNK